MLQCEVTEQRGLGAEVGGKGWGGVGLESLAGNAGEFETLLSQCDPRVLGVMLSSFELCRDHG